MRNIVVGVDESDGAAEALRWAAAEGPVHGVPVVAVLAWGYLSQHDVGSRFDPEYDEQDALEVLDKIVAGVLGDAAPVELRAVCDLPEDALTAVATADDLLVVGARGMGGFAGLLLGSVSHKCLHRARGPIAIVRERPGPPAGRVLVAYDGSEPSREALRWAVAEGRARAATVEVLHAWQPPYITGFPLSADLADPASIERSARQLLADAVADLDTSGLVAPVVQTVRFGGASETILRAATDADLVVLGSRGLGSLSSAVRGSVTVQVTQHAPCPVVVLPPPS